MMKWIKDQSTKLWFWIVITIIFLSIVQILFRIEAPCKWLDAVWEAGDLISLVGALVLGYIAVLQTQRANDMASDANKTSRKLIELQEAEYTPVVTIKNFAGITKHTLDHGTPEATSEVFVHVMRCTDGEAIVGYSISLVDENCDITKNTYCRDYEIHLNYSGHFVAESFQIKSIRFSGNGFERSFKIEKSMEISLSDGENFNLFLFLVSNEDFLAKGNIAHQYIDASHIILETEIKSMSGIVYTELIMIRKILVDNPSTKVKLDNAEMLVSASYQVEKETIK